MYLAVIIASLLTISMWVPYLTAATLARGMASTLAGNPRLDQTPIPAWATRLKQAHQNAAENLAAFVGVALVAQLSGTTGPDVVLAAEIYIAARAGHYIAYGLSIAYLRTTLFVVGWMATLYIGIQSAMTIGLMS
jgi:uncharacterized MAPEG superfamily protein